MKHEHFPNLYTHDHPLLEHKVRILRDRDTTCQTFRRVLGEIAGPMTYEALRGVPTVEAPIETPLTTTSARKLAAPITIVPILRAGLGMTEGILALVPEARTGHIGVQRNEETLRPIDYYSKLPKDAASGPVLLVDPMLATGGSAIFAIDYLRKQGCEQILMLCLVAAPEGVKRMLAAHPDVAIHAAALDEHLNDQGYIMPGLGDAGDRAFGTM